MVSIRFFSNEAENTTFAIGRRERKWYFRPTRQKKTISNIKIPDRQINELNVNNYLLECVGVDFADGLYRGVADIDGLAAQKRHRQLV